MKVVTVLLTLFILQSALMAQGRLLIPEIPIPEKGQNVYLKGVNAEVSIKSGTGKITLEQIFFNETSRRLEGEYLFPIPRGSQLYDFYLYINGQKTKGQVLDKDEAYNIYSSIVRKMRDPALLEYTESGLFKTRIFPIEPRSDRKIELSYVQVLEMNNETYRFVLPIKQSGQSNIEDFYLRINIEGEAPLTNIYSPSHNIQVQQNDDRHAIITLEEKNLESEKDFILYYSLANREINASLLSFRPRTDQDGYFLLIASPYLANMDRQPIPKDVIFIIDNSGSMQGEKIEQARGALSYCLNSLNRRDQFEIISFNSSIQSFKGSLESAGKEQIQNALYFARNLSAGGGTNINSALQTAMRLNQQSNGRTTNIVFLTDGLPTEGVTDIGQILKNCQNHGNLRIFSFGVGYDVNTYLLDKLSEDSHGSAQYVKPGENIESEVSNFFAKISDPVLTNPTLDIDQTNIYDIYPQKLPDIFRGQKVLVLGRYKTPGKRKLIIEGTSNGQKSRFEYEVEFENREMENDFIAKLWANRKVSHLLTQIRFHGENQEYINSIKQLGKEYGIVTPYTSFLVTEQNKEFARIENQIERGVAPAPAKRMRALQEAREYKAEEDEEALGSDEYFDALINAPATMSASTGKGAVLSSRVMKKMASADKDAEMLLTIKRIAGKTFQLKNGIWVESGLDQNVSTDKEITFLSDEYFELSKMDIVLGKILALGEKILFKWNNKVYKIS
jgi:Ca-activated chloride channel family protein